MQNLPDNEFDDFFKKSFEDPKIPFDPEAWRAMEKRMDSRRPFVWRFWLFGSLGVLLLALLGYLLVNDTPGSLNQNEGSIENRAKKISLNLEEEGPAEGSAVEANGRKNSSEEKLFQDNGESSNSSNSEIKNKDVGNVGNRGHATQTPEPSSAKISVEGNNPSALKSKAKHTQTEKVKQGAIAYAKKSRDFKSNNSSNARNNNAPSSLIDKVENDGVSKVHTDDTNIVKKESLNENESWEAILPLVPFPYQLTFSESGKFETIKADVTKIIKPELEERKEDSEVIPSSNPKLSLNFKISPDFSAVNFLKNVGTGLNIGVVFEYYISEKIRISTGIINSKKIYEIDGNEASGYSYGYSPPSIDKIEGDCDVLDIPINLRYNYLIKSKGIFFLSAGLSTYLMLKEDYRYQYNNSGYTTQTTIKGENNHFFSIMNLSAGYERSLGKRFGLEFEPFIKAPLSEIGYGKIKLKSAGAFVTLKYKMY